LGGHSHAGPTRLPMTTLAWVVLAPLALVTLVGLVLLWPSATEVTDRPSSVQELDGVVLAVEPEECPADTPDGAPAPTACGTVTVELEKVGAGAGSSEIEVPIPYGPGAPQVAEGDGVVVAVAEGPDGPIYGIVDQQRSTQLWVLLAAFSLALIAFGRWRGVSALVGLAVTFGILLVFMVPAIIAGEPPVLVALVAASAITLVVLYLTHGFSLATTVAVMGTMASLALTGVLSELAVQGLYLTGVTDDISMAVVDRHGVDARGLLVASIIIGSVGVLDDVTVTQSVTVTELGRANPAYRFSELYRAGSRVGRSHIASVVNTIVLAYAGSSLPLIVLVVADNGSLGGIASTQLIAQEVVRSAVATLGLIAAVPLTTGLAALVTRTAPEEVGVGA
jgi:uncharacterized membrane protein